MRVRLVAAAGLVVAVACGGKTGDGADGGQHGSSAGGDPDASVSDAPGDADASTSDAPGVAPLRCSGAWGGASSGEGDARSEHDFGWLEACSDGNTYSAECYVVVTSGVGSCYCCCAKNDIGAAGCGFEHGDAGVPDAGIPIPCTDDISGSDTAAFMACGFPPAGDE